MRLDARQVMDRSKKAFGRKDLWRTIYEDCYRYALPQRNLYDGYYEGLGGVDEPYLDDEGDVVVGEVSANY